MTTKPYEPPSPKDAEDYFKAGAAWDAETYGALRRSRAVAWAIAATSLVISGLSVLALVLVLPLKEFAPYVISVDRTTGYVEATPGFQALGTLTENEAITQFNIVRFVTARETYDPLDLQTNYNRVHLMSTGTAWDDYNRMYKSEGDINPIERYGRKTRVNVTVKNISFLNRNTASVRFQTTSKDSLSEKRNHYVAIVGFRYVNQPLKLKDRFENPLGFQVTSYRRDEEIIAGGTK